MLLLKGEDICIQRFSLDCGKRVSLDGDIRSWLTDSSSLLWGVSGYPIEGKKVSVLTALTFLLADTYRLIDR